MTVATKQDVIRWLWDQFDDDEKYSLFCQMEKKVESDKEITATATATIQWPFYMRSLGDLTAFTCQFCYALVLWDNKELHNNWHKETKSWHKET